MVQLDLTPCSYSKDTLAAAVAPSADVMDPKFNGIIVLLMRGNRVRTLANDAQAAKIHVVSGLRAGSVCWLLAQSVVWDGDRVKGRGAVDRATVCVAHPEEFDERFYMPGCCRDKAFKELLSTQSELAGPIRVLNGAAVRVRPPPYEIWVWQVVGKLLDGRETVCWVPIDRIDLDNPDDLVFSEQSVSAKGATPPGVKR